jgi:hypothetical protein
MPASTQALLAIGGSALIVLVCALWILIKR